MVRSRCILTWKPTRILKHYRKDQVKFHFASHKFPSNAKLLHIEFVLSICWRRFEKGCKIKKNCNATTQTIVYISRHTCPIEATTDQSNCYYKYHYDTLFGGDDHQRGLWSFIQNIAFEQYKPITIHHVKVVGIGNEKKEGAAFNCFTKTALTLTTCHLAKDPKEPTLGYKSFKLCKPIHHVKVIDIGTEKRQVFHLS